MRRRALLVGGAAATLACVRRGAAAEGTAATLAFRVMREGSAIGVHRIDFTRSPARTLAHIQVRMRVGIGPLTLFRYRHEAWELWDGGGFASLAAVTARNGTVLRVAARRVAGGVLVNGTMLAAGTIPFTHWNMAVTHAPLFDPEHGVAAPERVCARGVQPAKLADGGTVSGQRFDFAGRATISDWYEAGGTWAALTARAPDGSEVTYERL